MEEKGYFKKSKVKDINLDSLVLEDDFRFAFHQDFRFNKKGLIPEQNYYTQEGSLSWQLLNYFDDKSRITKNIVYEGDKSIRYFNDFMYNDEGNLTEEIVYNEDSTIQMKKVFNYNALNQEIEEKWTNRKRGPYVQRIYEYDRKGRKKQMRYTDGGQNDLRIAYAYNRSGNIESIKTYNALDETIKKEEYFEYKSNNLIKKITTNLDKESKTILHFTPKGLLIKIERFQKSVEEKPFDVEEHKFVYDDHENWIQKTIFKNGELFSIDFRDITYY